MSNIEKNKEVIANSSRGQYEILIKNFFKNFIDVNDNIYDEINGSYIPWDEEKIDELTEYVCDFLESYSWMSIDKETFYE